LWCRVFKTDGVQMEKWKMKSKLLLLLLSASPKMGFALPL